MFRHRRGLPVSPRPEGGDVPGHIEVVLGELVHLEVVVLVRFHNLHIDGVYTFGV